MTKKEEFLADLRAVYEKHGMIVHACGCCDSPGAVGVDRVYSVDGAIEHLDKQWDDE